jgi:cysteine-rich repeat protein
MACGNAYVDPGEMCDDGNAVSADGCRSDCQSDERCGNGVIDVGEACDDTNLLSHDGCSSRCEVEEATWSKLTQLSAVPNLMGVAAAYDEVRGRLVTFGGGPTAGSMTREWDGRAWIRRDPPRDPTARAFAGMVYDAARHQIVMFGGLTALDGELADTWTWDGQRWTEHAGVAPEPRFGHVMAYDRARERVVLFGGMSAGGARGDTWEWDGTAWAKAQPSHSPAPNALATAAYDPTRRVTVVYGPDDQTWLWNGVDWAMAGTGPATTSYATMTYSPVLDQLVLVGGQATAAWFWDGAVWTVDPTPVPAGHVAFASYFDATREAIVTVGAGATVSEMWECEVDAAGTTWTAVAAAAPPGVRIYPRAAYDPHRGRVVMFGGYGQSGTSGLRPLDETWELAGASWQRITTANPPPPTYEHAMAYDERRRVTVALGTDGKLYEYDGTSWVTHEPPGAWPVARTGASLAFDRSRGATVLFGGREIADDAAPLSDTWLWDGTAWREVTGGMVPPARSGHALAYDAHRNTIVLFGGSAGDTTVWEWDGAWHPIEAASPSPSARTGHGMTYDANLGEIVIHAGRTPNLSELADVWTWNGTRWQRISAPDGPSAAMASTLVYDPVLAATVVMTDEGTWLLRVESDTTDELCGTFDADGDTLVACADPDCWFSCAPTCPPQSSCL